MMAIVQGFWGLKTCGLKNIITLSGLDISPTVYIERLVYGPYCLVCTEKCTYISHHASHAGFQNFGHKGNHIEQLLLAFHISFQ